MSNPFIMRVIPADYPFANRSLELKELTSHAMNLANVVLFSPRRYGKTSLAKKIQADLRQQGFFTVYVDFFMTTSVNDVAARVAKGIYAVLQQQEPLIDKGARYLKIFSAFRPVLKPSASEGFSLTVEQVSTGLAGIDLLDKVLWELGEFIRKESADVHLVFDEFQEITELKTHRIEGIMRNHIQTHQASYFFVGSRRRVLLNIFNERNRPFYQSAIMYPLKPLPHEELVDFLVDQFKAGGKTCPRRVAEIISEKTFQYPYYAQSFAYNLFEVADNKVTMEDVNAGFEKLMASERYGYENTIQGLTASQIALLRALAVAPNKKIHTAEYMARHNLSLGGIQYAQKKLVQLDLIEKNDDGQWRVVDPLFGNWLAGY